MTFAQFLQTNLVYLDGGMGTLLQAKGLQAGEHPERWNLSHPDVITAIHRAYFDAGSNVVCTNTFGANALKFEKSELQSIVRAAVQNAKNAKTGENQFVALDIGPTGKLLKPLGDLDFEDAVEAFAETVRLGVENGVDLIVIETMNDAHETKAALLAAKENCDLPVIVTNAYGEDGKLMTGASPAAMVAMLEGMGVSALGANCSLGPKQLLGVVEELLEHASVPVVCKPNAGLPLMQDGKTVYDVSPEAFADALGEMVRKGLRVCGGCCGTTPDYIRALTQKTKGVKPKETAKKEFSVVSSYTHAVTIGERPVLIGERINPTGKKRLKQALRENDMDYVLGEAIAQEEHGADVLDVNVGMPELNEAEMLTRAVTSVQAVTDLPLQIDTADVCAMECAMRVYNGKPLVNSVNGKQDSMHAIFPLVKKYGGVVVALTLDENGIPETAAGRLEIAKKIAETAAEYGIDKKDLLFDPLAMTVSADKGAALVTLESLQLIRDELGCHTSLGVSNVSFGLPNRDAVSSTFFALALQNGLSAAIMNPLSPDMRRVYYSYLALTGQDENCASYIANADSFATVSAGAQAVRADKNDRTPLQNAIVKGLCDQAAALTDGLLQAQSAQEIINGEIIPALDTVGAGFEKKTVYLPQLLMSAEAAKAAFARIKACSVQNAPSKATFVLATVQGDIHDIGKNIVRLLLENYGYRVVDLGKDVSPKAVLQAVEEHRAPFAGLSALMTTTVPAMEETVRLLRERAPYCKVVVGGAVLTQEYADRMGAHFYARDAMETVRFAEKG